MNKKGSLSLSINAIVIIVIAFVVLGLGLSLTRTIFGKGESELIKAFDITELESPPTSSDPITIQSTVDIGSEKSKTAKIGFYNNGDDTAFAATFEILECLERRTSTQDGGPVDSEYLPIVTSPSENVGRSKGKGYNIIIEEKGLGADTYICTIGVVCNPDAYTEDCQEEPYETDTFFLKVSS